MATACVPPAEDVSGPPCAGAVAAAVIAIRPLCIKHTFVESAERKGTK